MTRTQSNKAGPNSPKHPCFYVTSQLNNNDEYNKEDEDNIFQQGNNIKTAGLWGTNLTHKWKKKQT